MLLLPNCVKFKSFYKDQKVIGVFTEGAFLKK